MNILHLFLVLLNSVKNEICSFEIKSVNSGFNKNCSS